MQNPGEVAFPGSGLTEEEDMAARRPDMSGELEHSPR